MSRIALFFILLACFSASGHARLGETAKEIEMRMGPALLELGHAGTKKEDGRRFLYHDPGWVVIVTLVKGRSCHEQYYKISPIFSNEIIKGWFTVNGTYWDKTRPATTLHNLGQHSEAFTTREVAEVLTANSNGVAWKTKQKGQAWLSPDGQRQARYFLRAEDGEYLVVTTAAFNRLLTAWEGAGNPPQWPIDSTRLRRF